MERLMESVIAMMFVALIAGSVAQGSEAEMIKADLVGHRLGRGEKSWKVESTEQIRQLAVRNRHDTARQRIYLVSLILRHPTLSTVYRAEAEVTYVNGDAGWEMRGVDVKSLVRVE